MAGDARGCPCTLAFKEVSANDVLGVGGWRLAGRMVFGRSVAMTEHAVVIAGGGPTGLMLALASVDVEVSDGRSLRAEYLVGRDGGRSLIRKAAGIEFPGWGP